MLVSSRFLSPFDGTRRIHELRKKAFLQMERLVLIFQYLDVSFSVSIGGFDSDGRRLHLFDLAGDAIV